MRTEKDPAVLRGMCERLEEVLGTLLRCSDAEAARVMGYKSTAQLRAVRDRSSFPDVERLVRLSEHARAQGTPIDLDWVLTGQPRAKARSQDHLLDVIGTLQPQHRELIEHLAVALAERI